MLGLGKKNPVQAKKLYEDRIYEPVVLRGGVLSAFYDVPINEIFMYAYHESTQTWVMMPFQIDEMTYAEDPFKPGNEDAWQDFYFADDNDSLDFRDELAFMVRDLGDKAADNNWIDNEEAETHQRLEIIVSDPHDNNIAYGYLFRSSTITEDVPTPYEFTFVPESHTVGSRYYSVRISKDTGLIEDVIIKPPFGTNVDIFDTQKIRFTGLFDFFGGLLTLPIGRYGSQAANERDYLHVYDYLKYTKNPVVRLIRQVRQTIKLADFPIDELAFYVRTKFYPFSGTINGGACLDPDSLKKEFNTDDDFIIEIDLLRQSWDFNKAASGMKFFNQHNRNVPIDGMPDDVNKTIQTPIKEWTLTTGDQGSMFTHVVFQDTNWQNVELYFYDNKEGGQGDGTVIDGGDTGDSVSYGDQGILFHNLTQDRVSLELGFTAYFLPGNLQKSDGEKLAYGVENPVVSSSKAISFPTQVQGENNASQPTNFQLLQNYPNPFNNSTIITFVLPNEEHVTLKIIDINGCTVLTLVNGLVNSGVHAFCWNGINSQNQQIASGIYFYILRSKRYSKIKKLILLR